MGSKAVQKFSENSSNMKKPGFPKSSYGVYNLVPLWLWQCFHLGKRGDDVMFKPLNGNNAV